MIDPKELSDEELSDALEEKYGENWSINDLHPDQELDKEFLLRLEMGIEE